MKYYDWNLDKDEELGVERGITFLEVVHGIMHGGLLDTMEHPNKEKYPRQRIFVVKVEDYVYLVPFVETEECIFLKTIIPSRRMTKKYLGGTKDETR